MAKSVIFREKSNLSKMLLKNKLDCLSLASFFQASPIFVSEAWRQLIEWGPNTIAYLAATSATKKKKTFSLETMGLCCEALLLVTDEGAK
jgi:hypothetical protein